ncbi:MAG TPA: FAD-binding oxidoreductase [Ktedonobacterales bacterium]
MIPFPGQATTLRSHALDDLTSWGRTAHAKSLRYPITSLESLQEAFALAGMIQQPIIACGAGHSYNDASLLDNGIVLDMRPMNRCLSWNAHTGVITVEPGTTLEAIYRLTLPDGWWFPVTPTASEATIGGCVAMNVHGRNAWKRGALGEHVTEIVLMTASGQVMIVRPDEELFMAAVGGAGLLGIITQITMQMVRVPSAFIAVQTNRITNLDAMFAAFDEHAADADFLEGWIDGFASGAAMGRGTFTAATYQSIGKPYRPQRSGSSLSVVQAAAAIGSRIVVRPWARVLARSGLAALYHTSAPARGVLQQTASLPAFTYHHPAEYQVMRACMPHGVFVFQPFVPASEARRLFEVFLKLSHEAALTPLWCIMKRHRRDPFPLSCQVDGYSLELNYRVTPHNRRRIEELLCFMTEAALDAGSRFYIAKDQLLNADQFRRCIGTSTAAWFHRLRRMHDPQGRIQSRLAHRLFPEEV